MVPRTTLPALFVLLTTFAVASSALAQTAAPADRAVFMVHGRVAALRSAWDVPTGTIVTYVEIDVLENFGAALAPARVVLKQLGGRVGDVGLWIAGQAEFRVGEASLLALSVNPRDGTLRTTGFDRGKVSATADTLGAARAASATTAAALTPFVAVPPEYATLARDTSADFTYLPTYGACGPDTFEGCPARWHEVDTGATVLMDRSPVPGTWTHASDAAVITALNRWRNSGMDLNLQAGAGNLSATACPATFTGNGRIAVGFNDPCGNVPDWVVGGGYYTAGDLRTVNGQVFQKFVQGFVVLNESGPQATDAGCFIDAVAHGLGHALGLGHSTSGAAVMQAGPPSSCPANGSALGSDDVAGITAIYQGIPSGATPPQTPTAFTASASLSTVTLQWTPAATGGQVQRYLIDAGTVPGNYNLGTITLNGPAASTAVGGVAPGTYYVRLRAQNLFGTSAPTAERSVTVGACSPPLPPASFTGTSNDTVVNAQWTPPASGVVGGYQIHAGSAPGAANIAILPFAATVTSLAASVPYGTYYARAYTTNVCGISAPSAELTLVVQPCAAAPAAPTALVGSVSGGVVGVSWTAPAGVAPTSYTIVVGSAPGGSDVLVYPTGTTATSVAAPAPRATYYVRVLATNPCGQSGASNEVVVVVP